MIRLRRSGMPRCRQAGFGVTGPLLALLGLTAFVHGAEDGGQPMAWSKQALGARAVALGQAVSALPGDLSAARQNPALAGLRDRAQASTEHALLPDGRSLSAAGLMRPFVKGSALAYSLAYTSYQVDQGLERRSGNTPLPDAVFKESASLAQLGLAARLPDLGWALGLGLKLYSQALGDASAGGVSGDLGAYWNPRPWAALGLVAQDPFSRLGWSGGVEERLPLRLRAGSRLHWAQLRSSLLLELEHSQAQGLRPRSGLEAWPIEERLALRAGWDGARFSGGFGLGFPWLGMDWSLDYAGVSDNLGALDLQHRFSLGLSQAL